MSSSQPPAIGEWRYVIKAKPRLTLKEELGKTGAVIVAHWYDPRARGGKGAPRTKSLGMSIRFPESHRTAGQINPELEVRAQEIAQQWHADLVVGTDPGTAAQAAATTQTEELAKRNLTIAQGFALYTDLENGRYPVHDATRADVIRAGNECVAALGKDTTWSQLVSADAGQKVWRHVCRRIAASQGVGGGSCEDSGASVDRRRAKNRRVARGRAANDGAVWAKRVVHHLFACANWLDSRDKIPDGACARPDNWQTDFKTDWRRLTGRDLDVKVDGPRFTSQEAKAILTALDDSRVDPRIRLNILCGGDTLRAGQVRLATRLDLDLSEIGEFGLGRLIVRGKGKKLGSVIDLDTTLRDQFDHELSRGYLRECEAAFQQGKIKNYSLFPQGRFVRGVTPVRPSDGSYLRPASKRGLLAWFHGLEDIAGVTHVPGRGWYGLRRLWADLGLNHNMGSRAREILGGWARGSKVPEIVYRSKVDEAAIRESSRVRSAIREELRTGQVSDRAALRAALIAALGQVDEDTLRRVLEMLGAEDPTDSGEADSTNATDQP